jgi:serine/threonine protein kinase
MRQCFERWQVGLKLTTSFQPCPDGHPDVRYLVAEDMEPNSTKKYFLMGKSTGAMLLQLADVQSEATLVAKVLLVHDTGEEGKLLKYVSRLARSRTPNIIPVHRVTTNTAPLEDLTCQVIVMAEGLPFRAYYLQLLDRCSTLAQKFAVQKTIAFQLVYVLHFLHHFDVQHRDIRPENIVFATGTVGVQQFIVDDVVFQPHLMHTGCLVVPQLIDFGLSFNREMCQQSDFPIANACLFKPPDMVFVRSLEKLCYENSDELFSLGLALLRALRGKPYLHPPPALEKDMAHVFDRLQSGRLSEHYSIHTSVEYAQHALTLVLLLGYPPQSYTAFYDTEPGVFLVLHQRQIKALPAYDWLARTKGMELHENTEMYRLLRKLLRWERHRRLSAAALLQTSFFSDLRADTDPAMQQWRVDR